jgi:hypothetical protein
MKPKSLLGRSGFSFKSVASYIKRWLHQEKTAPLQRPPVSSAIRVRCILLAGHFTLAVCKRIRGWTLFSIALRRLDA